MNSSVTFILCDWLSIIIYCYVYLVHSLRRNLNKCIYLTIDTVPLRITTKDKNILHFEIIFYSSVFNNHQTSNSNSTCIASHRIEVNKRFILKKKALNRMTICLSIQSDDNKTTQDRRKWSRTYRNNK